MKFRLKKLVVSTLIGACAVGIVIAAMSYGQAPQKKGRGGRDADAPVPVLAATASLADVPVYLDGVGTVRALNLVTVRPLVDGTLVKIAFREAQVRLDQGAIDNARAYVNWCTITSPLDGRTGIRLVDEGNIVHASDATGVVVVTQVRPIAVLFNLPQQQLGQVNAAFAKGPLPVEALGSDNRTVIDRGKLL